MSTIPPPPPGGGTPPPPPPIGGVPPPPGGATGYGQPLGGTLSGMPAMANFGQRLAAYLIDGLITAAMAVPAWIALLAGPKDIEPCTGSSFEPGQLCEVPSGGSIAVFLLLLLAALGGTVAYWGVMVGRGQTLGMKALSIRVADMHTGQPIGTGRGIGRFFAMYLSSFACYLGYLWMLWDDHSQTWHDKIVSTYVVEA